MLLLLAVEIQPTTILAYESAGFVQACCPARLAASGNELDRGVMIVLLAVLPDLQAQPFQVGWIGFELGRTRIGMPGIEQVLQLVEHEGAIARPHQGFSGGRHQAARPLVPELAALLVAGATAARAGL